MSRWCMLLGLVACVKVPRGEVPVERAAQPPRMVVRADAEAPNVYLSAMVAAGSGWDPVGAEGTAWLVAESIASGGTQDLSPDEVRQSLYRTGNGVEVVVGKEWTSFRLRCHRDQGDLCVDLFADMLTQPRFDDAELERLRSEAVYDLGDGVASNEEALAYDALDAWLFEGHPYGHPVKGRTGVLPTIDQADLRAFHASHYVREAVVVGVGGAVSEAQRTRLQSKLMTLPGTLPPELPLMKPMPVEGRSLLVVETDSEVMGFRFGHPLDVSRSHDDYPALYLAMTAFGAHRQSFGTLFQVLRRDRGLNYGTYAYPEPFRERRGAALEENGMGRRQSFFHLWIRPTSRDNGPFALKLALAELEKLVAEGLPAERFDDIQTYLGGAVPLLARDPGRRLAYAVEAAATGHPDPLVTLPDALSELTLDDVNAALKAHLRPKDLRVVAVGGAGQALVDRLTSDAPTVITYQGLEPDEAQAARDAEVAGTAIDWAVAPKVRPAVGIFQ